MKFPSGISALTGSNATRPWLRPLQPQHRALCIRSAAAAGSLAGIGLFRRKQRRAAEPVDSSKAQPPRQTQGFGAEKRRVTDTLLLINALAFAAQYFSRDRLTVWGIKSNAAIAAGQWWRLITPAFLHGNIIHLVLNSMALHSLGPTVELLSSRGQFLAVYGTAAVAATTTSYLCTPTLALGSSGAVFGVGGALAMLSYRNKEIFGQTSDTVLQQLGENLALNIVLGLTMPRIDNWAHMGGLIGGALAAYIFGPHFVLCAFPDLKSGMYVDLPPSSLLTDKTGRFGTETYRSLAAARSG